MAGYVDFILGRGSGVGIGASAPGLVLAASVPRAPEGVSQNYANEPFAALIHRLATCVAPISSKCEDLVSQGNGNREKTATMRSNKSSETGSGARGTDRIPE